MDGFKLHLNLEADDIRSYAKAKRNSADVLLGVFAVLGLGFVGLIGFGIVHSLTGQSAIGAIAMGAAIYGVTALIGRKRNAQYQKLANDFVDYDLIVDRDGIVQKLGRTETKYAWADLALVQTFDDSLEMKMWDETAIIVPKHLFGTEADFLAARSFIEEQQKWAEAGHA